MVVAREKDAVSLWVIYYRTVVRYYSSKMLIGGNETFFAVCRKQYWNKIHTSLNWTIFNLQLSLGNIHNVIEYDLKKNNFTHYVFSNIKTLQEQKECLESSSVTTALECHDHTAHHVPHCPYIYSVMLNCVC